MSLVDQAVAYVKQRERARTPDIARELRMSPPDVDMLLERPCADGVLITCTVEVAGVKVKEYRPTNAKAQLPPLGPLHIPKFTAWTVSDAARKPPSPPPTAQPAAPAPAKAVNPSEVDMTTTEKIKAALREHGPMTTYELGKKVKVPFLSQTCSQLRKSGALVVVGGGPRAKLYGLPGQKAEKTAEAKPSGGDHLTGTIAMLEQRRLALMVEVEKIDNAIAAVRALG